MRKLPWPAWHPSVVRPLSYRLRCERVLPRRGRSAPAGRRCGATNNVRQHDNQDETGGGGRVLPWLSHVTRSGVSGPSLTLSGSRQWSRLSSFPYRSRTRAPSLHRRYPASAVIQAPPPPCRPGLPLAGFQLECALHRQGFPCCNHPPLPCVPPPLPRRSRPVRASPSSRPMAAFPAIQAGRPPRCPFRGLLSVHSRCGPHGH